MRTRNRTGAAAAALACLAAATIAAGQVTVPNRPSKPLFRGQQGEERPPAIAFNPTTNTVTLTLSVEDVKGFFIPNLRRHNFAVFENGVRQKNVTVEVEHAPITLAVLLEMGGRSQQLNRFLAFDAVSIAKGVLDVLGREDTLGVFTYADRLHTRVDFDASPGTWEAAFGKVAVPSFSEANFYDAAIEVLERLGPMSGRKALLVISTGIDTFSQATFDDVVEKAEAARTPVYVIGLGDLARQAIFDLERGPLARVDWNLCWRQLQALALRSGGRAYGAASVDIAAVYDDLMENLRVRYVITYVPAQPITTSAVRTVEVRLIDPKTEQPLRIADASGRRVTARAIAQASYTPSPARQ